MSLLLGCSNFNHACLADELRQRFLQIVLRKLSARTGDVFVLERYIPDGGTNGSDITLLDFAIINAYTAPEKIIAAYFPRYRVEKSRLMQGLYFVYDAELTEIYHYGMLEKVPVFQFKGSEEDFLGKIGSYVKSIKTDSVISIGSLDKVGVHFPPAKLDLALQPTDVRHALGACIDCQKTRGIAWVADTRIKDGQPETIVHFTSDAVFSEHK